LAEEGGLDTLHPEVTSRPVARDSVAHQVYDVEPGLARPIFLSGHTMIADNSRTCARFSHAGRAAQKARGRVARVTLALAGLLSALAPPATAQAPAAPEPGGRARIEGNRMIADLTLLAHDSLEGRRAGTAGSERARSFLVKAFEERGIAPLNGQRLWPFEFGARGAAAPQIGVNVLGVVPGTSAPERYIVVTAHYDHLGVREGQVFNGADDNASGTAAILALAAWLARHSPQSSFVFAALDAEENGLRGARAFVADPPIPLGCVVMNVNLDMVSRSEKNELYAAGSHHYPVFAPLVAEVAARSQISLLTGHDRPGLPPGDDWTQSSDHGPFHEAGVPFMYFGVEDHAAYHRATDDAQDITPTFYVEAIETVLDFLLAADRSADQILSRSERRIAASCPRP
jgi:hypothetical protein